MARLAYSKVAILIIIDLIIEGPSIKATQIADILHVFILEDFKFMTYGAIFLGTRWHSAFNAVFLFTFPADRPAKFLFLALAAYRRNHVIIHRSIKLKTMTELALVVLLTGLLRQLEWSDELACLKVIVERI